MMRTREPRDPVWARIWSATSVTSSGLLAIGGWVTVVGSAITLYFNPCVGVLGVFAGLPLAWVGCAGLLAVIRDRRERRAADDT